MALTDRTNGPHARRHELGLFLRTRRRMLSPEEVGLAPRANRRGPGLSRDEVAFLSGISADWYGRLEGGLDIAPSAATLAAVSRVLRLTPAEIEYLFELAEVYPPKLHEAHDGNVPAALAALVLSTERVGVVLWDEYMTPLAWNRVADSMYRITPFATPLERNVVVRMADQYYIEFLGDDYAAVMRRVVGVFRRAFTLNPTPFAQQVHSIAQAYPQFRQYWDDHVVAEDTTIDRGPLVRHHPVAGSFSLLGLDLRLRRDDMLRITAPANDDAVKAFDVLQSLGTAFQ